MKNPIIKYGIIGGIVMVIIGLGSWLLLKDVYSFQTSQIIGYSSMIIALSSVFFAIRKYRDEINNGTITFGESLKVGILTTLIPSAFAFIQTIFFFSVYGTEFQDWALASLEKTDPTLHAEYVEQMASGPDWIMNPFFQGFVMFATVFFIGLIISLIAAVVLKRDDLKK